MRWSDRVADRGADEMVCSGMASWLSDGFRGVSSRILSGSGLVAALSSGLEGLAIMLLRLFRRLVFVFDDAMAILVSPGDIAPGITERAGAGEVDFHVVEASRT